MGLAVSACDSGGRMAVVIDATFPVKEECVEKALEHVDGVVGSGWIGSQLMVVRGLIDVYVTFYVESPNTVTISRVWMGRDRVEYEMLRASLIEDVQAAIMTVCQLRDPATKVTRQCLGARICEKWLDGS